MVLIIVRFDFLTFIYFIQEDCITSKFIRNPARYSAPCCSVFPSTERFDSTLTFPCRVHYTQPFSDMGIFSQILSSYLHSRAHEQICLSTSPNRTRCVCVIYM